MNWRIIFRPWCKRKGHRWDRVWILEHGKPAQYVVDLCVRCNAEREVIPS